MKEEQLAIRIRPASPNHHLWLNNGTWFTHYTLHANDYTKRRVRISLGTHNIEEAREARDRVLGRYARELRLISLQAAVTVKATGMEEIK